MEHVGRLAGCLILALVTPSSATDFRDFSTGYRIPAQGYCDQPYLVVTNDGHWLCTLTTGAGREGERGQHVVATISSDRGKSWSAPIDIEPAGGPKVISVLVDGLLCDRGSDERRKYGYGRFLQTRYSDKLSDNILKTAEEITEVSGAGVLRVASSLHGELISARIYDRYLRTTEAIGNYRAGPNGRAAR